MKQMKIFILLMIIALSNCISNLNYSSEIRKLILSQQKHQKKWNDSRDRSFIEKTVKTSFNEKEGMNTSITMQGTTETAAAEGSGLQERSEGKSEETAERRSKVKHKSSSKSKTSSKRTSSKSKTETKFIPLIFTAILGTMFIAKTVFTYVESHYKQKRLDSMLEQIKEMKNDSYEMKRNEIEACTMSTLMLASNKNIILVYKMKLIYIRAYKRYFMEEECKNKDCSAIKDIKLVEKCNLEKNSCDIFRQSKFSADFEEIHKSVDSAINTNLRILKSAKSSACDQRVSYKNIDDKVTKLEKEVVELEDQIAVKLHEVVHDGIKTFINSFLFGMKSGSDTWFTGVSYTQSSTTPLQLTGLTSFKLVRMTFLENPKKTFEDTMNDIEKFSADKNLKQREKVNVSHQEIKKGFEDLTATVQDSITPEEHDEMMNQIKDKIKTDPSIIEDENRQIHLQSKKLENHLANLNFAITCINFVRMIFSYLLIFDVASGGIGVFNMIEALLEVISRVLKVIVVHIKFSLLKDDDKQNKTKKYKAIKREMLEAYAQLAFSIVYLTFFPASIIIKGTFDAALKLSDMVSAIKQYSRQQIERTYYQELGAVKRKHSDLFKNYNICELKFYGYLNILTVLNTIIKDELEIIRNNSMDSYDKLLLIVVQNPDSKDYIKNQIKDLCKENIQFCSRNISGEFLTNSLSFSAQEVINLKKEAIYSPFSALGVANTLEEFKSFIDLGYEPISSINYFLCPGCTLSSKNEKREQKLKDMSMLMGCRLCSKNTVIRHVEILMDNAENSDIDNQELLYDIWRESASKSKCFIPSDKTNKVCKCIYLDQECLTKKLKYLRLSSNYILYYEVIDRTNPDGQEKATYPGLNNIMIWAESQNKNASSILERKDNELFNVKIDVGIWDSKNTNWMMCKDNTCHEYRDSGYTFNNNIENVENFDIQLIPDNIRDNVYCRIKHHHSILPIKFEVKGDFTDSFKNHLGRVCLYYLNNALIEKKPRDFKLDETIMESLKYNWMFHPTPIIHEAVKNGLKEDIFRDWDGLFEIHHHSDSEALRFTSEPFKIKQSDFTDFVTKLHNDCTKVCQDNQPDSYDFNTCPNKAINYNYITNKSFFAAVKENDKNHITKLINKQTPQIFPDSLDDDSFKAYANIDQEIAAHQTSIVINSEIVHEYPIVPKPPKDTILKYTINNPKQYITFKMEDIDKKTIMSLNLFQEKDRKFICKENEVEFNLSQIHNEIYVVVTAVNIMGNAQVNGEYITIFTDNDYIQIPLQKSVTKVDNSKDKFKAFFFIKPLPDMGLVRNKIYGKAECILKYVTNFKEGLIAQVGDRNFIKFIENEYSSLSSSGNSHRSNHLNFFNLMLSKTYSSMESRQKYSTLEQSLTTKSHSLETLKYHPFNIFNLDGDLGELLFKNKECKDKGYSFSIPIKFHTNDKADRSIYYRNLQVDQNNNVIESYELAGPDVREIYWIQFTRKPDSSTDDMINADKYGYFPFYSFEYVYNLEYEDYIKKFNVNVTGMLHKKLVAEDMKIQITIWVAYDYRHRYDVEDLCRTCIETKALLLDYEEMKDDLAEEEGVDTKQVKRMLKKFSLNKKRI